jgi:NADPH:quinone reductase-like Zn-dependent oxidoreductase
MRAWELATPTGPAALELTDRPEPAAGPTDVVVKVRAVSLNYRDLLVVSGKYARSLPPRLVPCSDAAGEVVAVGDAVRGVALGDRVTSTFAPAWAAGQFSVEAGRSALGAGVNGVLAELVRLPGAGVLPMPSHLSFEEAATLPCAALTAWHALFEETPFTPASTVLAIGSGGVSVFAMQFARVAGARVIATTRGGDKAHRLRELGAHEVVVTAGLATWGDRVRELTGGVGADQVIEVGGQGTFDQSVRAVRPGGTISLIGVLSGAAAVNLTPVLMRNIRVQGVMVGSREMFARMNAALAAHGLRPAVDRRFGFDEAPAAFAHLGSGAHVGKIVIAVG